MTSPAAAVASPVKAPGAPGATPMAVPPPAGKAPTSLKSPMSPAGSPVGSPPARYIVTKVQSPVVNAQIAQPLLPGQSPQGRFSPVHQQQQQQQPSRTYARPSTASPVSAASPVAPRALWTQPAAGAAGAAGAPAVPAVLSRANSIPVGSPVSAAPKRVSQVMLQSIAASPKRADPPVTINGRVFERVKELGSGSFGVVWEVVEQKPKEPEDGKAVPKLALKKSTPNKKELLEACLLEAEVLQQLARELPSEVAKRNFVPRYVTHCALSVNGNTQVLLAMSKLDGVPLDQWLYGINEHELKVISMPDLLDGPLPKGQRSTRSLESASHIVAVLMKQMTPVFGTLQKIAFHRDISAHNFLIDECADALKFAVLDFGLAVRSGGWKHEWKGRNIAGDPRYFAPSAWMQLTHGYRYLENNPKVYWQQQYAGRLDHYAFGILICEVFFALWKGPEEFEGNFLDDQMLVAWRKTLVAARAAWRKYWTTCVGLFQRFHSAGAAGIRHYLAGGHLDKLGEQLHMLVRHLVAVSELPQPEGEGSVCKKVAMLLKAAGDLVCPKSTFKWQELQVCLAELMDEPLVRKAHSRRRRLSTAPASTIKNAVDSIPEDDVSPSVSDESLEDDFFCVKVSSNKSDDADKAARSVELLPDAARLPGWKKSGHRRVWTLDTSATLTKDVVPMGIGFSNGEHSAEQA